MAVKQENRLGLATTLLADSDAPIVDIAFSAGFNSLRRFNTAFRTAYGLSPSEWRKQNA